MFDLARRSPDFLILGAQKAGTTSLSCFLCQHPRIKCAKKKEVGFFNRDHFYDRGLRWYRRQFPPRISRRTLLFEATPGYLYYPFCAERIFEFNSDLKLIVMLRNPTERAFSAWNMFRAIHADEQARERIIQTFLEKANPEVKMPLLKILAGPVFPDFHSCVQAELALIESGEEAVLEPSFVRRGLYARQLQRFRDRFPKESLLVLNSEDLKRDRRKALVQIAGFLGAPDLHWPLEGIENQHERPYLSQIPLETRKTLDAFFLPHNAALGPMLGRDFGWDAWHG